MKRMYLATGLAVLAVSAMMFTGCGGKTTTNAPAAQSTKEATASTATATKAPAQSQPTQAQPAQNAAANTGAKISVEDAKKAALAQAGVQESDVVYKKANLETEDGILVFEMDFYAGDTEYNYDIDAASGAVVKAESEAMDAEDVAERDALLGRASGATAGTTANAAGISEDRALEIALQHAGVAKSDVTASFVKQDYDDDRGITKYDVEFHAGGKEYNYDIDMTTGDIYEFDVDVND